MSNFQEVAIYNSGDMILLNLDLAYAVERTDYKQPNAPEEQRARCIIRFPDSEGEGVAYYVRETYEQVRAVMGFATTTANCPDNEGYGCACDPMNKAAGEQQS